MPLSEPLQQVDRTFVLHGGRKLIYFGGCDYFRLGSHPAVLAALTDGTHRLGVNVAASRSTTGNHRLYGELEAAVAKFFGAEAALLVASGYATNLVVAQALAGKFSHVCVDERSHGSVVDALRFTEATVITFQHRDPGHLRGQLAALPKPAPVLLFTDGMFSHDGSAAPLREYRRVLPHGSMMIVDDAHGAGVLGAQGQGTVEHARMSRQRLIQTVSLSKAFGCYGGAILCPRGFRDQIIESSRMFNGNTPLPLPLASAALAAIHELKRHPKWRHRMMTSAERAKSALRAAGRNIPEAPGPIVAITPRDAADAEALRSNLLRHHVFPCFIRYAKRPGYFRFMISSEHTPAQVDALIRGLTEFD